MVNISKKKFFLLFMANYQSLIVNILGVGRHQFRAKPVNSEIFVNLTLGIKKVVPRDCTVPEEFHMEIEERLKQRHVNDIHDKNEEFEFHARPVPKAILEGPVVGIFVYSFVQCNAYFLFSFNALTL